MLLVMSMPDEFHFWMCQELVDHIQRINLCFDLYLKTFLAGDLPTDDDEAILPLPILTAPECSTEICRLSQEL